MDGWNISFLLGVCPFSGAKWLFVSERVIFPALIEAWKLKGRILSENGMICRGKTTKMDGLFHGKSYEQMDDLEVFPLFLVQHPYLFWADMLGKWVSKDKPIRSPVHASNIWVRTLNLVVNNCLKLAYFLWWILDETNEQGNVFVCQFSSPCLVVVVMRFKTAATSATRARVSAI